jgi:hypothetical protein
VSKALVSIRPSLPFGRRPTEQSSIRSAVQVRNRGTSDPGHCMFQSPTSRYGSCLARYSRQVHLWQLGELSGTLQEHCILHHCSCCLVLASKAIALFLRLFLGMTEVEFRLQCSVRQYGPTQCSAKLAPVVRGQQEMKLGVARNFGPTRCSAKLAPVVQRPETADEACRGQMIHLTLNLFIITAEWA